jgi:hypothetical protein
MTRRQLSTLSLSTLIPLVSLSFLQHPPCRRRGSDKVSAGEASRGQQVTRWSPSTDESKSVEIYWTDNLFRSLNCLLGTLKQVSSHRNTTLSRGDDDL